MVVDVCVLKMNTSGLPVVRQELVLSVVAQAVGAVCGLCGLC